MAKLTRQKLRHEIPLGNVNAPILYFDHCSNYGSADGIASMTIEALRHTVVDGELVITRAVVAYLKCSPTGLARLREAINALEKPNTPGPLVKKLTAEH